MSGFPNKTDGSSLHQARKNYSMSFLSWNIKWKYSWPWEYCPAPFSSTQKLFYLDASYTAQEGYRQRFQSSNTTLVILMPNLSLRAGISNSPRQWKISIKSRKSASITLYIHYRKQIYRVFSIAAHSEARSLSYTSSKKQKNQNQPRTQQKRNQQALHFSPSTASVSKAYNRPS